MEPRRNGKFQEILARRAGERNKRQRWVQVEGWLFGLALLISTASIIVLAVAMSASGS